MAVSNDEEGIGEKMFFEDTLPIDETGKFVALIHEGVQT
jgi:hypothetical protein